MVISFFLITFMYSTADLLTEAKYAEKMQAKPQCGPALMVMCGEERVASLVAALLVGPTFTYLGNKAPFVIVLPAIAS